MRKFSKKQYIAAGATAVIVLGGAGAALAYWTSTGSGSGTAGVGTSGTVTVVQTTTVSGLFPGDTAQSLAGDFNNSSNGAEYVTSVTVSISPTWSSQTDTTLPACTANDFTLVQPSAVGEDVPVGTGVGSWTGGSIAMKDSLTNQDNCENVSVPLTYTSN